MKTTLTTVEGDGPTPWAGSWIGLLVLFEESLSRGWTERALCGIW
jgi:hypothetical protein